MEELTQIAAFFLGDGFWLNGSVAFSNTNEDLIKYYASMIGEKGFKTKMYRRKKAGNRNDEFTLVAEKRFTDTIVTIMRNLDTYNIPKATAFLRGIFDAEGCINFSSTRRGREVKISNTDKSIVNAVEHCLQALEIRSRTSIKSDKRSNTKPCFNVKIYGNSAIDFVKKVRPYKIWSRGYRIEEKVHKRYIHIFSKMQ
jgi:hypothetical protein